MDELNRLHNKKDYLETKVNLIKPIVVVSKCLSFEPCRYNGEMDNNKFVDKLKDFVQFISVCPEVEIGLPTPRSPIRIVKENEDTDKKLMQLKTGKDLTEGMIQFSNEFLNNLGKVDGFILKSRSPSCGTKDVKIYKSIEKGAASTKGKGFFGEIVQERYPYAAIDDDGRLKNLKIREHFLTKLYLLSNFRMIKETGSIKELMKFHSENKLLLMAYNQKQLKLLGTILGGYKEQKKEEVFCEYEKHLSMAVARAPRYTSNINVFMRIMGYFSEKLNHREKEFMLDTINEYREQKILFSTPLYVLKSYVVRFEKENLMNQTFFSPFPKELINISDSGKRTD